MPANPNSKSLLDRLRALDHSSQATGAVGFWESSRLVATLIFAATVAAIALISFVGVSTANLPVLPNQLANVRIVASAPFSYESAGKTRLAREQLRDRVPPVYRLENEPLRQFEMHLAELLTDLEKFAQTHATGVPFLGSRDADLATMVETFNAKGPYRVSVRDIETLLGAGDTATRRSLIDNGLALLRNLYTDGVHDGRAFGIASGANQLALVQIVRPDGTVAAHAAQSMDDALRSLRVSLGDKDTRREIALALFGLLSNGLAPSLVFDAETTSRRREAAAKSLRPIVVNVEQNQTIIEPGSRVTDEQYEMLAAHRQHLLANGDAAFDEGLQLFYRVFLVLAMVMASVIYIRLEDRATLHSNGRLALLALVVVFNLGLVRLTYALTGLTTFVNDPASASLLPYLAPTAIAPLLIAILIDAGSAIFMALLISIFTSVIFGSRLDLLVVTFLGSMVAIYGSRHTRKRGQIARAAALGGFTVAVFALFLGVVDKLEPLTVLKHMGTGLGTGLLTGALVGLFLPVLEGLFNRTTDITFLELTDYNHPLLRAMQVEAPGTYHHSLMVAQLAENAAAAIGSNPLLARVCALFHDIGKIAQPQFFSENQRPGVNPHDSLPPIRSAEIIKAHVEGGAALAIKHKLPRAVVEVIWQHHGTSLVRYFYHKAASADSTGLPLNETAYRYAGPRPRFKESAIIHLADGIEAASRSLRIVTPDQVDELVARIVRDRVADNQLDEAPLTFAELERIKASFSRTLLNMLHSRVEYPAAAVPDTGATKPASRNPFLTS
jgi:putative nucleotidyltransferase with HDIG domain